MNKNGQNENEKSVGIANQMAIKLPAKKERKNESAQMWAFSLPFTYQLCTIVLTEYTMSHVCVHMCVQSLSLSNNLRAKIRRAAQTRTRHSAT